MFTLFYCHSSILPSVATGQMTGVEAPSARLACALYSNYCGPKDGADTVIGICLATP